MRVLLDNISSDFAVPGAQSDELPPRGWPRRPTDETRAASGVFTFLNTFAFVTQAAFAAVIVGNPDALVTQNAFVAVIAHRPQGAQLSGNAPNGKPRSIDHAIVEAPSLGLSTTVVQLPAGGGTTNSDPQPPRGQARLSDYAWLNDPLPQLAGQDAFTASTPARLDALPPRGPARAPDYSFALSFPLELIAQDRFNPGKASFELPSRGPLRAVDYTALGSTIVYLTAPQPVKPMGLSTGLTELWPPAPARSKDYSFASAFFHGLDGRDAMAVGDQLFDRPPNAPLRLRDYTLFNTGEFPPPAIRPVGVQAADLPARGAARMRDGYPPGSGVSPALKSATPVTTEQFQVILII